MTAIDHLKYNKVRLLGNPQAAQTLLFAHGFGTDQSAWTSVAAPFLADFRVVLFDSLGAEAPHPAADPQRYLALDAYADDLLAICRALELGDAIAVGHSAGAMVCALAAIREPRRFSRLVMIGASPHYLDSADYHGGFSREQVDAIYQHAALNLSKWAESFASTVVVNHARPQLATHFADSIRRLPAGRVLTSLCAIFQSDYRTVIGQLDCPTLIVQTARDPAVPLAVAEFLHRQIKGSRLTVIDAEGHLPQLSSPDAVIEAIRDFLYEAATQST